MDNLSNYVLISAILFSLGLFGVITRRNGVAVLMGVELILNSANVNFLAFARFGGMNMSGHVYALFVIVLAAAEAPPSRRRATSPSLAPMNAPTAEPKSVPKSSAGE